MCIKGELRIHQLQKVANRLELLEDTDNEKGEKKEKSIEVEQISTTH
jgi:hypothetical protein